MDNKQLFSISKKYIPGGVNSPVRSFKSVGTAPIFVKKASGSKIYDFENKEYIDFIMSWGAIILGHAYKEIVNTIKESSKIGTNFGLNTVFEVEAAKKIINTVSSVEMVRFLNSGTEATMTAVRLARAYTKKQKIIKFSGSYHGHYDDFLVSGGSGAATYKIPISDGLTDSVKNTIVVPFNNIKIFEKIFKKRYKDIAAVILEPILGNIGVILPEEGFLQKIRELTYKYEVVLIFDEIITGFRFTYGGYQDILGIKPDLTCFGKILAGGLPIGVVGGKTEIMKLLAPLGNVYQAGTFCGNPIVVSCIDKVLSILKKQNYKKFNDTAENFVKEIKNIFKKFNIVSTINYYGSMFSVFFGVKEVKNYEQAKMSDFKTYTRFFKILLSKGVLFPPSQFESCFLSFSHSEDDLQKSLRVIFNTIKKL